MILTVVGSGTLVPSARRSSPALCLHEGAFQATVDGGTGTLRRQAELGIEYRRTEVLFFTHVHPDHTLDLLHFLFARKYGPSPVAQAQTPTVVGPPGFTRYVEHLREGVRSWTDGGAEGFRVVEMSDGETRPFGPLRVQAVALDHPVVDHGYRFSAPSGGTAAFTGDTADCPSLLTLARDVDVLVAECSGSREHSAPGHLTAPEAGRVAREARVGQLVLTHLYPLPDDRVRIAEAAREYSGPLVLAEDGMQFLV